MTPRRLSQRFGACQRLRRCDALFYYAKTLPNRPKSFEKNVIEGKFQDNVPAENDFLVTPQLCVFPKNATMSFLTPRRFALVAAREQSVRSGAVYPKLGQV